MTIVGRNQLTDWTNGTGVFPSGGSISISANTERQYIHVQVQDVGEVAVTFQALYANGLGSGTTTIYLNGATTTATGGGTEDMDILQFVADGPFTVSGTAGQRVAVLTA